LRHFWRRRRLSGFEAVQLALERVNLVPDVVYLRLSRLSANARCDAECNNGRNDGADAHGVSPDLKTWNSGKRFQMRKRNPAPRLNKIAGNFSWLSEM
jgi:hypothetical protein